MKRTTQRILKAIIAANCQYFAARHEHFYFYEHNGSQLGRQAVLPDDLNTKLMSKLKYNYLSDDLRTLYLTYTFNNNNYVMCFGITFTRKSVKRPFVATKLRTYVICKSHFIDDILNLKPNAKLYYKLRTDSTVFTINNITRVANDAAAQAIAAEQDTAVTKEAH